MSTQEGFSGAARLKKVRGPWLAAGVLLITLGAVGMTFLYFQLTDEEQFLVVTDDISRGEIVDRDRIGVASLSGENIGTVDVIPPVREDEVLGRRALTDLSAGTLLSGSVLAESDPVPDGRALVGINVDAGVYPQANLDEGDTVAVMRVPSGLAATADEPVVEVARAEVFSRRQLTDTNLRLFLTLDVDSDDAAVTALTASTGRAYLVQVQPGSDPLRLSAEDIPEGFFESDSPSSPPGDSDDSADPAAITPERAEEFMTEVIAMAEDDENVDTVQRQLGPMLFFSTGDIVVPTSAMPDDLDGIESAIPGTVYIDADQDGVDDATGDDIPSELTNMYLG